MIFMQMASSSLLSLSVPVLLFSISSAYTGKWPLPNGINQNPIRIFEATVGVSEDLLKLNGMEVKNNQESEESLNIIVGPWGGSGGKAFDDGAYTGIRQINLVYNDDAIGGFQVTYDLNGSPFVGLNHTTIIQTPFTREKIILEFPSEFILEVSGYIGNVRGHIVVRSLTFKTNKKTYGPYGPTNGTPFNLLIQSGYIVGLKGCLGYWLDNIAFYLSL